MAAIKIDFGYLSEAELSEINKKMQDAAYEIAEQMNIPPPTVAVDKNLL